MLVRVLEIPPKTGNFHFGGGESQTFIEVDWFRDEFEMMATEDGRTKLISFIQGKRYFDSAKAYLILHQSHTFTIGYSAP